MPLYSRKFRIYGITVSSESGFTKLLVVVLTYTLSLYLDKKSP